MNIGDTLPKPWDRWRVKELIHKPLKPRFTPGNPRPGMELACIIVNGVGKTSVRSIAAVWASGGGADLR
jgi:hypothetical protein